MYSIQKIASFILLATITNFSFGQSYIASDIKPELTKNANAVFRLYEINYTVFDTSKASLKAHYIITVLNKNGDEFAEFKEFYDKFSKITELTGKIYESSGAVIKKIKSSDFNDMSAVSNASIFDDNRVKYVKPLISSYPYTVEYEFTKNYEGYMDFPDWMPQMDYDISIEKATFNLVLPKKLNVRYNPVNQNQQPVISELQTTKSYFLQTENMPAIESELMSSGLQDITPIGYFVPEYFKIGGYTCKNDGWKNFGLFFSKLNSLPNTLSEKTISDLNELKKKTTEPRELAKLVYEYMQSRTRYVSIQLGIGGWQPFDASIVDKYGYGDCKALTNYTKALLNQVGIPSIYTLVRARKYAPDIYTAESFNQFNHAILCVPIQKDTIWLECTSQTIPFGFLGSFTDNRNVLLITEQGGKLARTSYYTQEQNQQKRVIEVNLLADGKAEAKVNSIFSGLQYDDNSSILYEKPEDQKEQLYELIKLPTFTINNYKISEERKQLPALKMNLDITATKYATTSGNRLLLPLNILSRVHPIPDVNKERKAKLRLRYSYFDNDSVIYNIPEGYSVESLPKNIELKTPFGNYSVQIINDANKVKYIRSLRMNDGIFSAEQYKEYVAFIKSISSYDNIKLSLIKKAG